MQIVFRLAPKPTKVLKYSGILKRLKKHWNQTQQILNAKAPCPFSRTETESGLPEDYASGRQGSQFLGLTFHTACCFPRWVLCLASGTSHWSCSFTPTAPLIALLGNACRDTDPTVHCWTSKTFLWNLSESCHDAITLTLCMPKKTNIMWRVPCLLPVWVVPGASWTTA
jgi:hypothetical protein